MFFGAMSHDRQQAPLSLRPTAPGSAPCLCAAPRTRAPRGAEGAVLHVEGTCADQAASPAEPRSYLERPDGIERRRCILAGADRKFFSYMFFFKIFFFILLLFIIIIYYQRSLTAEIDPAPTGCTSRPNTLKNLIKPYKTI